MLEIVKIGKRLDLDIATKVSLQLYKQKDRDDLALCFDDIGFVFPFSTLYLLSTIWTINHHRESRNLSRLRIINYKKDNDACSYLGYFGFFRNIGIDFGTENNGMRGKYIPITEIKLQVLLEEAHEKKVAFQEIIEKKSEQIVRIILPNEFYENQENQLLSYSLREIIRNCFEHGLAKSCYVMGQRWENGYAELAILDLGVGIKNALSKKIEIASTKKALQSAILPGVSSGNTESNDYYANSGFGLFVTSELCKRYGKFALCSSEGMLKIQKGKSDSYLETPPVGTLVRLRMKIPNGEYFPNVKQKIISEGENLAKSVEGSARKASKASKN